MKTGDVLFKTGGRYLVKGSIEKENNRLYLNFKYNEWLKNEVKALADARWHGFDEPYPKKIWSVKDNDHNRFQLEYLTGENPYADYDKPLIDWKSTSGRPIYDHQVEMVRHILTRHHCIIAGDPGVGKTLGAIEAIESSGIQYVWWVAPKSAILSVQIEFAKWHSPIFPVFLTYEAFKKEIQNWRPGVRPPEFVVFDEAFKLVNPETQQTKAAQHLADSIREEYLNRTYIVLMTGTPNPKDPTNWWSLSQITRPGFLKEGQVHKLNARLSLMQDAQGFDGGSYRKRVTWFDNERKCKICGKFDNDPDHDTINVIEQWYHPFTPSVNEVALLYKRLAGLVLVKMKSQCLSLPEIIYRRYICKPTQSILNAAAIIDATSESAIKALTLRRELSDGFQYVQEKSGVETCSACKGTKIGKEYFDLDDPDYCLDTESISAGHRVIFNDDGVQIGIRPEPLRLGSRDVPCITCGSVGTVPTYSRVIKQVPCPKDDAVVDLLEQYEECGRAIIWAGFTGAIDRCVTVCQRAGWHVIRLDGRGWYSLIPGNDRELMRVFQEDQECYQKVAFIGQPGSGGTGLTLTASPVEIYFSNTYKFVERDQSINRFHRPGADFNRGCTVWDIIHLPSDLMVLKNLEEKRDLQAMTLGQLKSEIETVDLEKERLT